MKILSWLVGALVLLFWRWYGHLTLWQTLSVGASVLLLEGVSYALKRSKAELIQIDSLARLQRRLQYRTLKIRFVIPPARWGFPRWITRARGWDLRLVMFSVRYRIEE